MKGTVALVTGGTSGIGRATAIRFAKEGAKVFLTGRRKEQGEETVKLIKEAGSEGYFFQSDISKEVDAKNMVDEAIKRFGQINFAFNNAGIDGVMGPLVEQTEENFHQIMNINVLGVLFSIKYEIPAMLKCGGGAIVNNASVAGIIGFPGLSVYVASKHAVLGLTRTAALEVAKENIRINAISPAAIETDMIKRITNDAKDMHDFFVGLHPIGRMAKPEEVASTVIFLCSKDASFMTGSNLLVDGGFTAQ